MRSGANVENLIGARVSWIARVRGGTGPCSSARLAFCRVRQFVRLAGTLYVQQPCSNPGKSPES
jgi:hypothetical protein